MNPVTAWLMGQKHLMQKGHEPEWIEMGGHLFCMSCERRKGKGGRPAFGQLIRIGGMA